MSDRPIPGRSFVSKRAILEVIRSAVVESYGVTGLADPDLGGRLLRWLHLRTSGIRLDLSKGVAIELFLTVAYGVPIAEVARQVDSAVRYSVRRAMGLDVDQLVIHVGDLSYQPARAPVAGGAEPAPRTDASFLSADVAAGEAVAASDAGAEGERVEADGPEHGQVAR
jgi:uncharacterized alkaline shock family protein YloU